MTEALHRARCVLHPGREAAGICTRCRRYFCRECVTEHEGRLRCARCLAAEAAPAAREGGSWRASAKAAVRLAIGVLAVWTFFLAVSELLMALPRVGEDTEETAVEGEE